VTWGLAHRFNRHITDQAVADLVVGKRSSTDPLDLLKSFDISMCKAFYDGETFHFEDPHLTFNMASRISPPRAAVIEAYLGLPTYLVR
jgi:hypothetical protein